MFMNIKGRGVFKVNTIGVLLLPLSVIKILSDWKTSKVIKIHITHTLNRIVFPIKAIKVYIQYTYIHYIYIYIPWFLY